MHTSTKHFKCGEIVVPTIAAMTNIMVIQLNCIGNVDNVWCNYRLKLTKLCLFLYFGGNPLYKNVKVCAYCGSREDSETAIKITHPTNRPTTFFAYAMAPLWWWSVTVFGKFPQLSRVEKIFVSKNLKVPPNYKFVCDARSVPKSTYPPVGEKYKRFIEQSE